MESGDELRRLREVLEPRPESIERVVRGALAETRPARSPRLVPAVAGLAALLALVVIGVLAPRPRPVASIENVGEVLIVRHGEEGGRWRIHNGDRHEGSPPSGSIIVIHGGAK